MCYDLDRVGAEVAVRDGLGRGIEDGGDVVLGGHVLRYRGGVWEQTFLYVSLEDLGTCGGDWSWRRRGEGTEGGGWWWEGLVELSRRRG